MQQTCVHLASTALAQAAAAAADLMAAMTALLYRSNDRMLRTATVVTAERGRFCLSLYSYSPL
jgi:hypothetical protein